MRFNEDIKVWLEIGDEARSQSILHEDELSPYLAEIADLADTIVLTLHKIKQIVEKTIRKFPDTNLSH